MKNSVIIVLFVFSSVIFSQNNFLINTPTGYINADNSLTVCPEPSIVKLNLSYYNRLNIGVGAYLGKNVFSGKGGVDWDVKMDYFVKFRLLKENIILPHLSIGFFRNPYNNIFDNNGRYFFNRNCAFISTTKKISLYDFHNTLAYPVDNEGKEEYIWLMGISRKILLTEFFFDASYILSKETGFERHRFNFGVSIDLLKYFRFKFTISDFTRTASKQFWISLLVPPGKGSKYSGKYKENVISSRDFSSWPTAGGIISSEFGERKDPFTGRNAMHSGIDIEVTEGTPVYSILKGEVIEVDENGENGKYIIVKHKKGLLTYYLHLSQIFIEAGKQVSDGEILGLSGNTGRSKGAHLHFGTKLNNEFVNPLLILKNIEDFK